MPPTHPHLERCIFAKRTRRGVVPNTPECSVQRTLPKCPVGPTCRRGLQTATCGLACQTPRPCSRRRTFCETNPKGCCTQHPGVQHPEDAAKVARGPNLHVSQTAICGLAIPHQRTFALLALLHHYGTLFAPMTSLEALSERQMITRRLDRNLTETAAEHTPDNASGMASRLVGAATTHAVQPGETPSG